MGSKLEICSSIINPIKVKQVGNCFYDKELLVKNKHEDLENHFSFVNLKEKLKQYPRFYKFLIRVISHAYVSDKIRNKLVKQVLNLKGIIVNVASGNLVIHENVISVDLFDYPNVDIVSDAVALCLKDDSVDLVINEVSLEHIYDYKAVISETYRVLKKGGRAYFTVPFMYEFHASPNDFHRFTSEGLKKTFEVAGFQVKELGIFSGAASSFVGIVTEFLAIFLSFGIKRLYEFWIIFFMLILFPIKFLDYFLNRISYSKNIASSFYIIVGK